MNATFTNHPDTVDCPRCDGSGYDGVDEAGCHYACYFCGTSGFVSRLVAEEEAASAAAFQAQCAAEEAARRAAWGVPAGWTYYLDPESEEGIRMFPPAGTAVALPLHCVDNDIPF
jgi:hypothetical protein